MKRLKLYSIYTKEAVELKNIFLRSIQDDWEINICYLSDVDVDGNWGTKEFGKLMRKRIKYIIEIIEKNWSYIVIWSDIDIQFFRGCSSLMMKAIAKNDIVFQSECWPSKEINAGFIVMRCNQKTLLFFKSVLLFNLEKLKYFDQSAMNQILSENSIDIKWDILPPQFWAMSHRTLPPKDIVLHHANCTSPITRDGKTIGSVELKLEQYKEIRKFVIANK
jgi:hypothetical protein